MASEQDQPAGPIIEAFGGIRPMAAKLDIPVSTVQGWKQRDTIPAARLPDIERVAVENDIVLPTAEVGGMTIDGEATVENEPSSSGASKTSVPPSGPRSTGGSDKPTASKARQRLGGGLAVGLSLLALVVSLGVAGWVWWNTAGPDAKPDPSGRIAAIESRLSELNRPPADPGKEEREKLAREVADLRSDVSGLKVPDIDAALAPLRAELAKLSKQAEQIATGAPAVDAPELLGRLAALEAEINNVTQLAATNMQAMSGGIVEFDVRQSELEERVAALDAQLGNVANDGARQDAVAAQAMALTISAGQLRRAIARGAPYADTLSKVEAAAGEGSAVERLVQQLAAHAQDGVATRDELLFSFPDTAVNILDNAPTGAENNIVDQLLDRAQRIVRVRRVGTDVPEDSLDGRIARAELRLEDGDVAGAISAIENLDGAAGDAAAPWLARARAHVDARQAADAVEDLALARLQAVSGS